MKTQINKLKSGLKNQILNSKIDYSQLPASSSHIGHSGSNSILVNEIWNKITNENQNSIKIDLIGLEIELKANWSLSRKSVSYSANISENDLEERFGLKSAKNQTPFISIQGANIIMISNGKNNFTYVCPSLINIL